MNTRVEGKVVSLFNVSDIVDLDIWPPSQGSYARCSPLVAELRFAFEEIFTQSHNISVRARRAKLTVWTSGAEIVRGSRLGDQVNEPYVSSDVELEAISQINLESGSEFSGEISVEKGIWGGLTAKFFKRRSKKVQDSTNHLTKVKSKIHRLFPINSNTWMVVEPLPPGILSGRYLGTSQDEQDRGLSLPLCLLDFKEEKATITIELSIDAIDLEIKSRANGLVRGSTPNQKAIVQLLLKKNRTAPSRQREGAQRLLSPSGFLAASAFLEVSHADCE